MFDIGWTEMMVIAVVAILVIGPKDLPAALRAFGKWTGKMKRMARDFQGQFNEALREAEIESVRKEVAEIGKIDPIADLKKDLNQARADIKANFDKVGTDAELKKIEANTGTAEPAPASEPLKPDAARPSVEAAPPLIGAAPPLPAAPVSPSVVESKP